MSGESLFQESFAVASQGIDQVFAECWEYIPMASDDTNARKVPDPERAPTTVFAVFLDPYARAFSGVTLKQGVKAETPGHASSRPQFDVENCQMPYAIREGDRVERQRDRTLWTIAEVRPDGINVRTRCDLNRLSKGRF